MNTTLNMDSEQNINSLIAPNQDGFVLPEGIVMDGTDFIPTVQQLI